jgi:Ca2+-binding RTX toxin-like protein
MDYLNGGSHRDSFFGRQGDDCLFAKDGHAGDRGEGGPGRDYSDFDRGDHMDAERRTRASVQPGGRLPPPKEARCELGESGSQR